MCVEETEAGRDEIRQSRLGGWYLGGSGEEELNILKEHERVRTLCM